MIKNISIKRFRCFRETRITEFALVNLITGKNVSGKSCLLEALYLASNPYKETVLILQRERQYSEGISEEIGLFIWDTLFFNQNKEERIEVKIDTEKLVITHHESLDNFIPLMQLKNKDEYKNLGKQSTICLEISENAESPPSKAIFGVHTEKGFFGDDLGSERKREHRAYWFPVSEKTSKRQLVRLYDKAKFAGKEARLLEAFKLIDERIEAVSPFSFSAPALYLKMPNQQFLPIALFGDAINRIASFILVAMDNDHSILLIDEIENGIHYTKQKGFWDMLFKLAKDFQIQIFATTHSDEMINAYKQVVIDEELFESAGYFELLRHFETEEIVANKIPIDVLDYMTATEEPHRGE